MQYYAFTSGCSVRIPQRPGDVPPADVVGANRRLGNPADFITGGALPESLSTPP